MHVDYPLLVNIIKDVGFPIAVAIFVLFRLNGTLDKLKHSIDNLSDEMQGRDENLVRLTSKVDMLERTVYRLNKRKRQALKELASNGQQEKKG